MKTLYQALTQKLAENPKLKTLDLYNQKFFSDEGQSLALPAVLLEFGNINWARNKQGVQQGEVNIRVYILLDLYEDFYAGADTQSRALAMFDFVEEVYLALQDFSGDNFSPLERKSSEIPSDFDSVMVHILSFRTVYSDSSKAQNSKYTKVEPDIAPKRVGIDP
jgi:hypothetical protein